MMLRCPIAIVATLFLLIPAARLDAAVTVEDAIAAHAATLAKIDSLYVKIEVTFGVTDQPLQRMSVSESWRSGTHERTLQRVLQSLTKEGMKPVPEEDRVVQFSYSDKETRTLRGWDPDTPLTLPLDETRNAAEFGRVKGGIGPRDPQGATSDDWTALLLEITRGLSLPELARTAQIVLDEKVPAEMVRLRVVTTDQPNLLDSVIDLDPQHGYLIRRIDFSKLATVAEVDGFTSFGEGIWLPDRVKRTVQQRTAVAERVAARVNDPIDDTDLVVQFPEGSRVDEVATGKVFLWGKDEPAEEFASFALFHEHQIKALKAAQPTPVGVVGGTNWLLWVNVVGIAVLLLLMTFRKRLVEP